MKSLYGAIRQKKQRIADLKAGEAIVKLSTGEQVVTQFYTCQSEHVSHTPKTQAALTRYEHVQFERKAYGAYIEDPEMDLQASPQPLAETTTTTENQSKAARVRLLLAQNNALRSAEIARIVGCDPSVVSRERARLQVSM